MDHSLTTASSNDMQFDTPLDMQFDAQASTSVKTYLETIMTWYSERHLINDLLVMVVLIAVIYKETK